MKGTSFQKPLEYRIEIQGESWRQGDPIEGSLTIRNHNSTAVPLTGAGVQIAYGTLKKVWDKKPGAFDILADAALELPVEIAGQKEQSFAWKFETDPNFSITDVSGSPFVLYGKPAEGAGDQAEKVGQLQLTFHPAPAFQEFLNIFQVRHRFALKSVKARKRGVEAKFTPPEGNRAFTHLDHVMVSLWFGDEDTIHVNYAFHIKKLEPTAASAEMKKKKTELEQAFGKAEYLLPSGRMNDERFEAAIGEALKELEPKL